MSVKWPDDVVEKEDISYEKMNPEYKAIWLDALRSGNHVQGQQKLAQIVVRDDGEVVIEECCLGVACNVLPIPGYWIVDPGDVGGLTDFFQQRLFPATFHYPNPDYGPRGERSTSILSESIMRMMNLDARAADKLMSMNDGSGEGDPRQYTFAEIADWIEENL